MYRWRSIIYDYLVKHAIDMDRSCWLQAMCPSTMQHGFRGDVFALMPSQCQVGFLKWGYPDHPFDYIYIYVYLYIYYCLLWITIVYIYIYIKAIVYYYWIGCPINHSFWGSPWFLMETSQFKALGSWTHKSIGEPEKNMNFKTGKLAI